MATDGFECPACGTTDESLRNPAPRKYRCTDCEKYDALVKNAKLPRKHVETPGVDMSREEFLLWIRSQPRTCTYCEIPEEDVQYIGAKTQVGHDLRYLGIDRIDNEKGYEVGNVELCCFPCNKAKSNTFSYEEMKVIGRGIAEIWRRRLAKVRKLEAAHPREDARLEVFRGLAKDEPHLLLDILERGEALDLSGVPKTEFDLLLHSGDREVRQRAAVVVGKIERIAPCAKAETPKVAS